MGLMNWLLGKAPRDTDGSQAVSRPAASAKSKSFDDLMNDYYAAANPYEQYKILQRAAGIATTQTEKLQVVVKINQIKRDHGF